MLGLPVVLPPFTTRLFLGGSTTTVVGSQERMRLSNSVKVIFTEPFNKGRTLKKGGQIYYSERALDRKRV